MNHAVVYVPGLGDQRSHTQKRIVAFWRIWGLGHTEVLLMQWHTKESFDSKLARLAARIDGLAEAGYAVSLVGVSAGASAVVNAYAARQGKIHRVICICGKLQRPETISSATYQANPAFKQSLDQLPASLARLSKEKRSRILSIRPLIDESVPPEDTVIDGANSRTIPAISHTISIAVAITFYSPSIARFIRRS